MNSVSYWLDIQLSNFQSMEKNLVNEIAGLKEKLYMKEQELEQLQAVMFAVKSTLEKGLDINGSQKTDQT